MVKKVKKKKKVEVILGNEDLYKSLTSIRFRHKGKIYEIDVGSELLIGGEDIHNQVERIPGVMGYFGPIVALLKEEYKNKKALCIKIEAQLDRKVREAGITGEQRIDKAIKRQPKWMEAQVNLNAALKRYNKAQFLYSSLKEKSIALISRSADIRNIPHDSIRGVTGRDMFHDGGDDDDS